MGLPEGLGGIGAIALGYPATTPAEPKARKEGLCPDHPINASDGESRLTGCPEEISAFVRFGNIDSLSSSQIGLAHYS